MLITKWLDTALEKEQEKYKKCPVTQDWISGCESAQGWGYVVTEYLSCRDVFQKERIHVFADKACHHHTRPVRQWPERPGRHVKPIFQPACAPDLNAIERLSGIIHREVARNRVHADVTLFAEAIDDFFQPRRPHEWRSWRDAATDNFRIISHKDLRVWSERSIFKLCDRPPINGTF